MAQIDWEKWRKQFVQGPDDLDYKRLSEYKNAPAYSSIRNRASKEDWPDQRKRFRDNLGTLAGTVPEAQQVAQQVAKIVDTAEMITRHAGLAKLMGGIAQHEFIQIRKNQQAGKPTGLKPAESLSIAKIAVELERLTEGLATQRQEIDFSKLSDAELEKIANGGL